MAKLGVFLEGTQIDEIELDQAQEYLVGRGTMCDVVLDHPKVSRQHLKLSFNGKLWNCKVLSRFGNVQVNGHLVEDFSLIDGVRVSVPPFELHYLESAKEKASPAPASKGGSFFEEKTQIAAVELQGRLIPLHGDGSGEVNIGREKFVAGRSQACELILKAPEASRRHFSIQWDGQNYVLTDLKSANKTLVNGKDVSTCVLESGDEITVGSDQFRFEIVHPDFDKLPAVLPQHNPLFPNPLSQSKDGRASSPAVIKVMPGQVPAAHKKSRVSRLNTQNIIQRIQEDPKFKVKAALAALVLIVFYQVFGGKKEDDPRTPASGNNSTTMNSQDSRSFDKLTPEQKKFIEEEYNLSMNLYTSGKYDMAGIEIERILKMVTNYKDARNIRDLCQQALEIKKQQDEVDRRKRDEEDRQRKITDILDHCEELLKARRYGEVEPCTDQITNLDPDNDRARNLMLSGKEQQAKLEASAEYRAEAARRKDYAIRTFRAAEKHLHERNFLPAVKEYETVRKIAFVDNEHLKEKAEVGIKSAKVALMKQSNELVTEGKTAIEQKDFGGAVEKFNKALAIYPSNGDALDLKAQAARELHLEMKNLYSESVIEENLGNIESAKKKWRQIIKQDEKTDNYLEKSKIKLQKYER